MVLFIMSTSALAIKSPSELLNSPAFRSSLNTGIKTATILYHLTTREQLPQLVDKYGLGLVKNGEYLVMKLPTFHLLTKSFVSNSRIVEIVDRIERKRLGNRFSLTRISTLEALQALHGAMYFPFSREDILDSVFEYSDVGEIINIKKKFFNGERARLIPADGSSFGKITLKVNGEDRDFDYFEIRNYSKDNMNIYSYLGKFTLFLFEEGTSSIQGILKVSPFSYDYLQTASDSKQYIASVMEVDCSVLACIQVNIPFDQALSKAKFTTILYKSSKLINK